MSTAPMEKQATLAETLQSKLNTEELANCMRCGFCLPACPTFNQTGFEAESPRGRIALMKAVSDGFMEPDQAFVDQMNHCLGCRACEPACPAGVHYGELIEQARDAIEDHHPHKWPIRALRKVVFKGLFPHQRRMRTLGMMMKVYQKSGMQRAIRKMKLLRVLPRQLAEMEAVMPAASSKGVAQQLGNHLTAKGERLGTVAMFSGCIMDVLFTQTNIHTVKLLNEAGFDVVIPDTQNCCGALHAHSGETDQAKALAKRNIVAFEQAEIDYIASNAGGCGALLVEYGHLLKDDPQWSERAATFSAKVLDICDIVLHHGRVPAFAAAGDEVVTYQDSCHLRNVMRGGTATRTLLRQVEGVNYREMAGADTCCGSAGIYNLTQPEMAGQLLEKKMKHACATDAAYLISSNPGCMLQMKNGVNKHHDPQAMQVEHVVDFLYARIKHKH